MIRGCIPVLMMAAVLVQAQLEAPGQHAVGGLSIPAEITTTVRAEKAHRGDPVEFRTMEAVLIANGVVMPKNPRLIGRIVGAAPRQGDKPSWLVLLVERAEWKKQSVPLHAFIARQIAITSTAQNNPELASADPAATSHSRRPARENARSAVDSGVDISPSTKLPQDSKSSSRPETGPNALQLGDVRLVRDKDGIAYLFSSKSNVTLPSGTLFVLQSQDTTGPVSSGAADSNPASPAPQQ
ncbi:MAG TPA: hypothetical protein VIH91_04655 [Terriglobales bacterium]